MDEIASQFSIYIIHIDNKAIMTRHFHAIQKQSTVSSS